MSTVISQEEQAEFIQIYLGLMYFIWLSGDISREDDSFETFLDVPDKLREVCRDLIYLEDDIIDEFKAVHDNEFDDNSLELLDNIYAGLLSEFIVLKDNPEFAILYQIDEKKFYKVVNITGPFREIMSHIPTKIKTAIVDFKGRIVCDGVITESDKMLATVFVNKLNKEYEQAHKEGTVVTLLD